MGHITNLTSARSSKTTQVTSASESFTSNLEQSVNSAIKQSSDPSIVRKFNQELTTQLRKLPTALTPDQAGRILDRSVDWLQATKNSSAIEQLQNTMRDSTSSNWSKPNAQYPLVAGLVRMHNRSLVGSIPENVSTQLNTTVQKINGNQAILPLTLPTKSGPLAIATSTAVLPPHTETQQIKLTPLLPPIPKSQTSQVASKSEIFTSNLEQSVNSAIQQSTDPSIVRKFNQELTTQLRKLPTALTPDQAGRILDRSVDWLQATKNSSAIEQLQNTMRDSTSSNWSKPNAQYPLVAGLVRMHNRSLVGSIPENVSTQLNTTVQKINGNQRPTTSPQSPSQPVESVPTQTTPTASLQPGTDQPKSDNLGPILATSGGRVIRGQYHPPTPPPIEPTTQRQNLSPSYNPVHVARPIDHIEEDTTGVSTKSSRARSSEVRQTPGTNDPGFQTEQYLNRNGDLQNFWEAGHRYGDKPVRDTFTNLEAFATDHNIRFGLGEKREYSSRVFNVQDYNNNNHELADYFATNRDNLPFVNQNEWLAWHNYSYGNKEGRLGSNYGQLPVLSPNLRLLNEDGIHSNVTFGDSSNPSNWEIAQWHGQRLNPESDPITIYNDPLLGSSEYGRVNADGSRYFARFKDNQDRTVYELHSNGGQVNDNGGNNILMSLTTNTGTSDIFPAVNGLRMDVDAKVVEASRDPNAPNSETSQTIIGAIFSNKKRYEDGKPNVMFVQYALRDGRGVPIEYSGSNAEVGEKAGIHNINLTIPSNDPSGGTTMVPIDGRNNNDLRHYSLDLQAGLQQALAHQIFPSANSATVDFGNTPQDRITDGWVLDGVYMGTETTGPGSAATLQFRNPVVYVKPSNLSGLNR